MVHRRDAVLAILLLSPVLGFVGGVEKLAFKKGSTDAVFGSLCPETPKETTVWFKVENEIPKNLWACHGPGLCKIVNHIDLFQRDSSKTQSISLKLIPNADSVHAGSFNCQTDPSGFDDSVVNQEFNYEVTVYENKLTCDDNVSQHVAGQPIELSCGITAWGKGSPDLEFRVVGQNGAVESVIGFDSRDGMNVTKRLTLRKELHGKSLHCAFKGFDGASPSEPVADCVVNNQPLNVLYPPEITSGPMGYAFAKQGEEETLSCKAVGNPAPTTSFYYNGDQEVSGQFITIDESVKSVTCQAKNSLGVANSTKNINVVTLDWNHDAVMKEGQTYPIECDVRQSNPSQAHELRLSQFVGDEKISTTSASATAKREWNGKGVVCVANSGDFEYRKEFKKLNVQYGPYVTCEAQTSDADFFLRHCQLAQNPRPFTDVVKVSPKALTVDLEIEWTVEADFSRNFTIKFPRAALKEANSEMVLVIIKDQVNKEVEFKYEADDPEMSAAMIGLIAGVTAGVILIILIIALCVMLIKRGNFVAPKKGLTEAEKGDYRYPSDDGHGQPPANRSMNGYDNKVAPNDDGLVYADLAFSDHQPRSRAPIIDPYSTTDYADIDFGPHPPPYSVSDSIG